MYKNIMVAVDLTEESHVLLDKAIGIAKYSDAKVIVVYAEANYSDLYAGLVVGMSITASEDEKNAKLVESVTELVASKAYAKCEILHEKGELDEVLLDGILAYKVDLLIMGRHQDFWSRMLSSTRRVINESMVDMLIVPFATE